MRFSRHWGHHPTIVIDNTIFDNIGDNGHLFSGNKSNDAIQWVIEDEASIKPWMGVFTGGTPALYENEAAIAAELSDADTVITLDQAAKGEFDGAAANYNASRNEVTKHIILNQAKISLMPTAKAMKSLMLNLKKYLEQACCSPSATQKMAQKISYYGGIKFTLDIRQRIFRHCQ